MRLLQTAAVCALLGLGGLLHLSLSAETPPPTADVPPRVPPEEAKKTLRIADGLEIQLLAHEPLVQQPLCLTFDDRGRL